MRDLKEREIRACAACGAKFSPAKRERVLSRLHASRGSRLAGLNPASLLFEEAVKPTLEKAGQRFEHYELVTGEDGKPVELGRGAMGVTYKAFDVDLRCPVTLKVIS